MRRRRSRRWTGLLVLIPVIIAGLVTWKLTWVAPSWWSPPDAHRVEVVQLAETAERRIVEEAQQVRPPEKPWTVRIRDHQVNAWLAARLPQWIEHHAQMPWPEQIGLPQVLFEDEGINIAVEVGQTTRRRIIVARFVPSMIDDQLRLHVDRVALGRLALPGAPVHVILDALHESAPEAFLADDRVQILIDRLFGGESIEPVLRLVDDRTVRLVGVHCGDGLLELQCVTELQDSLSRATHSPGAPTAPDDRDAMQHAEAAP